MIHIQRRLLDDKLRSHMVLQIHDELIFETPPDEAKQVERLVREEMERVVELKVPLKVDTYIGKNWGEI